MEQSVDRTSLTRISRAIERTMNFTAAEQRDNAFFVRYSILCGLVWLTSVPVLLLPVFGLVDVPYKYQFAFGTFMYGLTFVWMFMATMMKIHRKDHLRTIRNFDLRHKIDVLLENPIAETLGTLLALGYDYPTQYYTTFMCDVSWITDEPDIHLAVKKALLDSLRSDIDDIGPKGVEQLNKLLKRMKASSFRKFDPQTVTLTLRALRKFGNQETVKIARNTGLTTAKPIKKEMLELAQAIQARAEESHLLHI